MAKLSSRSTRTPLSTDIAYISDSAGTADGKVVLSNITTIPETTRTVNFTSSQTAAQIQAEIDAVGKYLPEGTSITFQFGNGTYSLDSGLTFSKFYGGGIIRIYGNTGETNATTLHTTQDVVLDFKGNSTVGLFINANMVQCYVYNLRIETDNTYDACIFQDCNRHNRFWYNSCLVNGSGGIGASLLVFNNSAVEARTNYFTGGVYGIYATTVSEAYSNGNDDTVTQPVYGLRASSSTIYKNGTQPTGSTANELQNAGGEIR